MPTYADLAVYNRYGQLTALVEIKNKPGTSRTWAARLRRNRRAYGGEEQADFFLLVTPDKLYLWKNATTAAPIDEPIYEIDTQDLFAPYDTRAAREGHPRSSYGLELLVAAWLSDLMRADIPLDQLPNGQQWLLESDFVSAVHAGHLADEVRV